MKSIGLKGADGKAEFSMSDFENLKKENAKLDAELTDAVAVVQMALALMKDPDDRLGLRDIWTEKAEKLTGEFYERTVVKLGEAGRETRYQDWVGD